MHAFSIQSAMSLQGPCPEGISPTVRKCMCTSLFVAASFTICKHWKQCKCPCTEDWVNSGTSIHSRVQYHSKK